MSSTCHVFTLIFRISYTSNNEMQCVHKAAEGSAAERARERDRGKRETSESTIFPSDGKCGRYSEPQEYLVGRMFCLNRAS